MSTEFYNTQWQMPNEANKSKRANYSLKSASTASRVKIPGLANNLNLTNKVSLSIWFKTTLNQNNYYILGLRGPSTANGFDLGMHGSNIGSYAAFATSGSGGLLVNFAYDDGNWHHYVLTYDGTIRKFYIDGVLKAESAASGNMSLDSSGDYFILATSDNFNRSGQGEAVDNCVFDYALSDGGVSVGDTATGQIAELYGDGLSLPNPMSLSPTPKAYYKLSDSVWDGSEYITANNAAQDYVFDFNPNNVHGHINLGASTLTSNTYSLSLWFNSTSTSTQVITEKQTGTPWPYRIYLYGTGNLELLGTQTSGTVYNDGKWHNVVIVQDPSLSTGKSKGYVDGVLVTSSNSSGGVSSSNNFYIGGRSGTGLPYKGKLSNFQLFDAALSATEIETLYNYGSPIRTLASVPQSSNLKVWYKLDASEIYNSSITDWEVNDATATYNSSSFVKPLSNQNTQYIQVNNFAGLTGASAGSWSFWYNTQDFNNLTINGGWFNGGQARWIGPYGTPHTGYTNTGEFNIYTSDGMQRTSLAASYGRRIFIDAPAGGQLNKWAHFVGTYDGSNLRVYMNGEQVGTGTGVTEFAATGTLTTTSIRFGGAYSYNSAYDAKFSNGSVWNKTLTLAEIVEIYNNGKPKSLSSHSAVSNLVSWWKLDNLTTGLVDSIGSYNATLVGSNSEVSPGSVSVLNGESSAMSQSNLVQSDLQTVVPYSKYAINFNSAALDKIDTPTKIFNDATSYTASIWAKGWSTSTLSVLMGHYDGGNTGPFILTARHSTNTNGFTAWISIANTFYTSHNDIGFSDNTKWLNLVATWDGSNIILYVNGIAGDVTPASGTVTNTTLYNFIIGGYPPNIANYSYHGQLSNCSVWNTALSAAQVREVYNEGLPSDLNSHSAYSNLISWWKLGEGVSYDGTYLIVQDYKGNNHGTSNSSMDQSDIVNGVGTYLNGASSGLSAPSTTVTNIITDAPYSDKNATSINMQSAKSDSGISSSTPQAT